MTTIPDLVSLNGLPIVNYIASSEVDLLSIRRFNSYSNACYGVSVEPPLNSHMIYI